MAIRIRILQIAEDIRESYWFLPGLMARGRAVARSPVLIVAAGAAFFAVIEIEKRLRLRLRPPHESTDHSGFAPARVDIWPLVTHRSSSTRH